MKEFFKKTFTKENIKKFYHSYIWLIIAIFVIDIVSKWVVAKHFNYIPPAEDEMITVIPKFLFISLSYNDGMAWSLFASTPGKIVLACISLLLGIAISIWYKKGFKNFNLLMKIGVALMIAGAFGNFIDRAFYWEKITGFTGVIDWIQVWLYYLKGGEWFVYQFPTFNIADSALVIGVILLLIEIIIESIKDSIAKGKAGEYKYSPEELEKKQNEQNSGK